MAHRKIVEIDEEKCDGCGRCVPSCAEGAIRIVNGKAKLVSDVYCDGLGACLGKCPRGAITIIEREAAAFDEAAVNNSPLPLGEGQGVRAASDGKTQSHFSSTAKRHGGCPGAAMHDLRLAVLPAADGRSTLHAPPSGEVVPALSHWPIQLRLVPPDAPFLRQADLFLVADCVPFACADFHGQLLRRRPVVIGCPKLDDGRAYVEKLADMLVRSEIASLTVVHMEVPCCTNLVRIAAEAMRLAGVEIPLRDITITIRGEVSRPL